MLGEWDLLAQNVGKSRITIFAFERSGAVKHFVNENAQSPPIHCTGMPTSLDDLRCDVLFGSNKRVGPEVGNARFRVYRRKGGRAGAIFAHDHRGLASRS